MQTFIGQFYVSEKLFALGTQILFPAFSQSKKKQKQKQKPEYKN